MHECYAMQILETKRKHKTKEQRSQMVEQRSTRTMSERLNRSEERRVGKEC